MNKKILILTIFIILLVKLCFPTITFAEEFSIDTWDQMEEKLDKFEEKGKTKVVISSSEVAEIIMPIAQILVAVASGVLVVVTAVMGVKYATVGSSSPDEKAKMKKQLVGLVVSVIVVFGAQAIWALIYNLMKDI